MKIIHSLILLITALIILPSCKPGSGENLNKAESVIVYSALKDFKLKNTEGNIPFYRDSTRNALAINAAKYKNQFSKAVSEFKGESGVYNIRFTSLRETDGESTYRVRIAEQLIGEFQNKPTSIDYEPNINTIKNIKIEKGQTIEVEFNSHSNDKIPEGDGFAFSRGRWTEISFQIVD